MKVMVTGASGFIGSRLIEQLALEGGTTTTAVVRRAPDVKPACVSRVVSSDFAGLSDLSDTLRGIDAVVHLANAVYVRSTLSAAQERTMSQFNLCGTLRLAEQAAAAGVHRFVYVSSAAVNGDSTSDAPFRETNPPNPRTAYARSKAAAENGLRTLAIATSMQVVIIRPPLVYGPHVSGNFRVLMRLVKSGIPLPLAAVKNLRSFISVDNLTNFILVSLSHPRAANQAFLVSDGQDLSTPELIRGIAAALGRPPRLFTIPPAVLTAAARITGQAALAVRLIGSLQLDISRARGESQG